MTKQPANANAHPDGQELNVVNVNAPKTNTARIALKLASATRPTPSLVILMTESASACQDLAAPLATDRVRS